MNPLLMKIILAFWKFRKSHRCSNYSYKYKSTKPSLQLSKVPKNDFTKSCPTSSYIDLQQITTRKWSSSSSKAQWFVSSIPLLIIIAPKLPLSLGFIYSAPKDSIEHLKNALFILENVNSLIYMPILYLKHQMIYKLLKIKFLKHSILATQKKMRP